MQFVGGQEGGGSDPGNMGSDPGNMGCDLGNMGCEPTNETVTHRLIDSESTIVLGH